MKLRRLKGRLKGPRNDLFANLPSEIIIEILSRLPVRSIVSCKLVRKSWLALIETPHFLNSHLSKPATALVLFNKNSHTIYEFEDELDIENHKLPFTRVIHFCFPKKCEYPSVSANGLLLHYNWNPLTFYISNPITREYIQLPELHYASPNLEAFGFGASKVLGQHKVVMIFQKEIPKSDSECYVYTTGTGVWRKMEPPTGYGYYYCIGEFVNDNLHWLVSDLEASRTCISCFHLENKTFSTFSFPPMPGRNVCHARFCAVWDTLCLLNTNSCDTTAIWLMKQYGDDQSWAKQFVIISHLELGTVWPIRVLKNGEVVMAWSDEDSIFYLSKNTTYFNQNRTVRSINNKFDSRTDGIPFLHTPSFLHSSVTEVRM